MFCLGCRAGSLSAPLVVFTDAIIIHQEKANHIQSTSISALSNARDSASQQKCRFILNVCNMLQSRQCSGVVAGSVMSQQGLNPACCLSV